MALDVSNFYSQASAAGTAQKKEYFDYMDTLLNNQQQVDTTVLNKQYNQLVDTLNTGLGTNLRENYIQSTIGKNEVKQSLERSGVADSGYGKTQETLVSNNYANLRGNLLSEYSQDVKDVESKRATSLGQLMSDYASKRADAYDKSLSRYDTAFNQKYGDLSAQLDQQNADRDFEEGQRQFNASLAEQQASRLSNQTTEKLPFGWVAGDVSMSYGDNGNIVYSNSDGAKTTVTAGTNPFTNSVAAGVKFTTDAKGNKIVDKSSVYSNLYQPKEIVEITGDNKKISQGVGTSVGKTTVSYGNSGSQEQTIWQTKDGRKWVWNGPLNRYVQYTK